MGLIDNLKMPQDFDEESGQESEPQFEQDPEPGERPAKKKRRQKTAAAPRKATASTAKMARQVAQDLTSLIEGTAIVWGMSDQCCAPILEAQAKPIAEALTAILARNPRLLARFADTDIVAYTLQAAALGRALLPVGKAVYNNHVSKAYEGDEHSHGTGINLGAFPAYAPVTA